MFHKNFDITVFTELARQKSYLTGVRGRSLSLSQTSNSSSYFYQGNETSS